jgi:hypothetical protein
VGVLKTGQVILENTHLENWNRHNSFRQNNPIWPIIIKLVDKKIWNLVTGCPSSLVHYRAQLAHYSCIAGPTLDFNRIQLPLFQASREVTGYSSSVLLHENLPATGGRVSVRTLRDTALTSTYIYPSRVSLTYQTTKTWFYQLYRCRLMYKNL